jgi:subtilisin family serine protease
LKKKTCARLLIILLAFASLTYSLQLQIPAMVVNHLKQETIQPITSSISSNQTFKPTMLKPSWVDQNNNGIADTLDQEITNRQLNNTAGNYANVIVELKTQPTTQDANEFTVSNGYLTTSPWLYAIYGFGGQIPYNKIANFAQNDPNVLLIEKDQVCHAQVAYAAKQIGARTYVWNTLGLQGDPQSSIAIVDTGIDASHPDFSPGYGNVNFSKKIVGWNDQVNSQTSPYDDEGHGSHCSGLAAGNGFFSTNGTRATATRGANFGSFPSNGTYLISGMMVNATGTITVKFKWVNSLGSGSGICNVTALPLYYGDKTISTSSWIKVASVNTPNQNTWYTLTYNVTSTPLGGYDMYHIPFTITTGTGSIIAVFTVTWPYTPPSDGYSAWTGIAPQAKLVGIKVMDNTGSGNSQQLVNGINWLILNRMTYHVTVASMSLGFSSEVASVDTALVNLVNSGVTCVVAAGNSGSGSNYIYTPGSVNEVMTVAAMNQFDNIASYSSQGGSSHQSPSKTTKPDITAPGGSFYGMPIYSVDSNYNDAEGQWTEIQPNDAAGEQGTSMATPIVAGAAEIIVQALGGYSNWQYTRSQALQPKMILLMTATETYPNLREGGTTSTSPTLGRGGKDVHEGYGRINLNAAVDAILKTYQIGTTLNDTLGTPPTTSDISVLGQKLAWARKVQLNTKGKYNFTLTNPIGVDFDLFLYNSTGTSYGEPAIVAKSINATTGGREQIILTASYNGTYYLVVKRATATTGNGTFNLQSIFTPNHDVAVLKIQPSATSAYQGDTINITVTVKNKGLNTESFNVTTFYNSSIIGKQTLNLGTQATTNITFRWSTSGIAASHYALKAQASNVPNEYNTTNNILFYTGTIQIKIPGDINGDMTVNNADLTMLQQAYDAIPISPNWNPNADLNKDGKIDASDLNILSRNYGKTA